MLPRRLSKPGPVLEYMGWLFGQDRKAHADLLLSVRAVFSSPDGKRLLELLDEATTYNLPRSDDDNRAWPDARAQALIAADFRRLMSDEPEQLAKQADATGRRPSLGKRPGA